MNVKLKCTDMRLRKILEGRSRWNKARQITGLPRNIELALSGAGSDGWQVEAAHYLSFVYRVQKNVGAEAVNPRDYAENADHTAESAGKG